MTRSSSWSSGASTSSFSQFLPLVVRVFPNGEAEQQLHADGQCECLTYIRTCALYIPSSGLAHPLSRSQTQSPSSNDHAPSSDTVSQPRGSRWGWMEQRAVVRCLSTSRNGQELLLTYIDPQGLRPTHEVGQCGVSGKPWSTVQRWCGGQGGRVREVRHDGGSMVEAVSAGRVSGCRTTYELCTP